MWENHTCGLEGGTPGVTGCPYPIRNPHLQGGNWIRIECAKLKLFGGRCSENCDW